MGLKQSFCDIYMSTVRVMTPTSKCSGVIAKFMAAFLSNNHITVGGDEA